MKVAFYVADQNPHRDRTKGITVYTDSLLQELTKSPELQLTALASRSSYRPTAVGVDVITLPLRTDRGFARLLTDQLHGLSHRDLADLWHYPKGFLPLGPRYSQPTIGTVHDVILQYYADHYPQARSRPAYGYWLMMLKHSISRFDAILTVSKFSQLQIAEFCERHRLRIPPITSAVEGTDWTATPANAPKKSDYVLHLASVEPHKQTARLLRWWKRLEDQPGALPRLLVVGRLSAADEAYLASLRTAEHRPTQSRELLLQRLGEAQALILPSEIEGFGLPALEAFSVLTPVVYVQHTAVEEVIGAGAAGAFDLPNYESFRAALEAVLALPAAEVRAIRNRLAAKYTWEAAAEAVKRVYQEAAV